MTLPELARAAQAVEQRGWFMALTGDGVRISTPRDTHFQLTWAQIDIAPSTLFDSVLDQLQDMTDNTQDHDIEWVPVEGTGSLEVELDVCAPLDSDRTFRWRKRPRPYQRAGRWTYGRNQP